MTSLCATDAAARAQPWLGTLVAIRIRDAGECDDVAGALDAAFAAVRRVHALMSFHDPASELSALNRRATRAAVALSEWTWTVLGHAAEIARASAGAFDCGVGAHLVRSGRLPAVPGGDVEAAAGGDAFHERLEFLPGRRVRFRRPMLVDLGGIAKGFAVDRAVAALRARGVAAASVNAGGDLRVFGAAAEPIFVRRPDDPASVAPLVQLRDGALATSADYVPARGARPEHDTPFIDPRRGRCCGHGRSVSVAAADCTTADALTKVVLVTGDVRHAALKEFDACAIILDAASERTVGR
jgi:thiamine biosynthesis lipoprotein